MLRETPKYTLLEINPLTGRKNQIRVHMADLGHPIIGDRKYGGGGKGNERLALHAWKIEFRHPRNNRTMAFISLIPKEIGGLVHLSADEALALSEAKRNDAKGQP